MLVQESYGVNPLEGLYSIHGEQEGEKRPQQKTGSASRNSGPDTASFSQEALEMASRMAQERTAAMQANAEQQAEQEQQETPASELADYLKKKRGGQGDTPEDPAEAIKQKIADLEQQIAALSTGEQTPQKEGQMNALQAQVNGLHQELNQLMAANAESKKRG